MFIPYRVDVPFNHRPVMNWFVVTGVIVVFILQIQTLNNQAAQETMRRFVLDGWGLSGLFGHMWLHAGLLHLIGNLIFLWLFGNAVCSKLGNVLYLPVYVGLGLIAAASHVIFCGGTAVGASGAINGIVGMYLVFFPQNVISCFFWLIFLFTFRPIVFCVSGFWMILLWFAFDIYGAFSGAEGIAYVAHIGGFLGGFGLAVLMLKLKWIEMERDEKSILQMLKPKRRKIHKRPESKSFRQQKLEKSGQENIKSEISTQEHDIPKEKFIRFKCLCGQKIKVPREYAGKNGQCPKCSTKVKIPEQ